MTHIAATSSAAASTEIKRIQASRLSGASFAAFHTAAVQDAKDKAKATSTDAKSSSAPKGERTQKVEGHRYVEIISGPRNGMFINNSGNARDGQAFVIVRRDGREFHIYGTGKNRNVYEVGRERAASGTSQGSGTGTTGTTGASATGTTGQTGSTATGTSGTATT
ncbi:MAG TPA: hypothetical protein VHF51_07875 [Solirubrobacteraceae bacterium]|nr:hypothetical protein [Solirubrobacteraceae bacterium]